MICRLLNSVLLVAAMMAHSLAQDAPPSWSCRPDFHPVNNKQIGGCSDTCNATAIDELLTLTRNILDLLQNQDLCCTPTPDPDVNECASNHCQNGGTCMDNINGYSCDCMPGFGGTECESTLQDCVEIQSAGMDVSGVYNIYPEGVDTPLSVFCDMETDGGGWTVFQRRQDGTVDFYLDWNSYKHGFGNVSSEHWLGNDNIHLLSTQKESELRIDLEVFDTQTRYATYSSFSIGDETAKYILTVDGYSGDAGDSLSYHSGSKFSTKDQDNDAYSGNCAKNHAGAWWYAACRYSNLNGLYLFGQTTDYMKGVTWNTWRGSYYSLKTTEMKMRPV